MWRAIAAFLVAALIIYLSYLCSKLLSKSLNRNSSSRYMRLLDQITVGQDRHLAVVQIGEKYLLVGITAGQINLLAEMQDEDLLPISLEETNASSGPADFKDLLKKLGKYTKRGR